MFKIIAFGRQLNKTRTNTKVEAIDASAKKAISDDDSDEVMSQWGWMIDDQLPVISFSKIIRSE